MTLNEFIVELEKTPRRWELLGPGGALLRLAQEESTHDHCPVSAVAGSAYDECSLDNAGRELGLREGIVTRIANASDELAGGTKLRARLLKACGIT